MHRRYAVAASIPPVHGRSRDCVTTCSAAVAGTRTRRSRRATSRRTTICSSGFFWLTPIGWSNAVELAGYRRDGRGPRRLPRPRIGGARRRVVRGDRCARRSPRRGARGTSQTGEHGAVGMARGAFSSSPSSRAVDSLRRITTASRQHDSALVSRPTSSRRRGAVRRSRNGPDRTWPRRFGPRPRNSSERIRQAAEWLARVEFVRHAVPELNWPDFDDRDPRRNTRDGLPGKIAARRDRANRLRSVFAKPADPRAAP